LPSEGDFILLAKAIDSSSIISVERHSIKIISDDEGFIDGLIEKFGMGAKATVNGLIDEIYVWRVNKFSELSEIIGGVIDHVNDPEKRAKLSKLMSIASKALKERYICDFCGKEYGADDVLVSENDFWNVICKDCLIWEVGFLLERYMHTGYIGDAVLLMRRGYLDEDLYSLNRYMAGELKARLGSGLKLGCAKISVLFDESKESLLADLKVSRDGMEFKVSVSLIDLYLAIKNDRLKELLYNRDCYNVMSATHLMVRGRRVKTAISPNDVVKILQFLIDTDLSFEESLLLLDW